MECIKIFVFALLFSLPLTAQIDAVLDEESEFNQEAGIGFNFINSFLPFDDDIGVSSPFQIYHNRKISRYQIRRTAYKLTINGNYNKDGLDDQVLKENNLGFLFRIGYGKIRPISSKFDLTYGSDLQTEVIYASFSVDDQDFPQGNSTLKDYGLGLAVGPFVGLYYNFNDRLSLYTETTYYFGLNFLQTRISVDDINEDFTTNDFQYGANFLPPSYLVLFYRF